VNLIRICESKVTEQDILFFFVLAFFTLRLVAFFPLTFPEALTLEPVFLGVDLRFDLGSGSGSEAEVDSESRSLVVVTKLLRVFNTKPCLDMTARSGSLCVIGKIAERKSARLSMNDNIVRRGTKQYPGVLKTRFPTVDQVPFS
jgi:hypothetical protein